MILTEHRFEAVILIDEATAAGAEERKPVRFFALLQGLITGEKTILQVTGEKVQQKEFRGNLPRKNNKLLSIFLVMNDFAIVTLIKGCSNSFR